MELAAAEAPGAARQQQSAGWESLPVGGGGSHPVAPTPTKEAPHRGNAMEAPVAAASRPEVAPATADSRPDPEILKEAAAMTTRDEYLKALSEAPGRPLSDDQVVPGLPGGEWALPHLWALAARSRDRMSAEVAAEHDRLVDQFKSDFAAGNGPWDD